MSMASELPSLRLDATREEALERAAAIVADAWQSFDRARPGQPGVDERLQRLLRAALPDEGSSALGALDDALGGLEGKNIMVIGHDPHPGIRMRSGLAEKDLIAAGATIAGGEIQQVTSPATGRTLMSACRSQVRPRVS